jgi:ribosomal protein L10
MTNQIVQVLKTEKFITKYPIILFFQHNNLSVKQWLVLRNQLKNIESGELLLFKNTLIKNVLIKKNLIDSQSIFQGPCFALGFSDFSQFHDLLKRVNSSSLKILLKTNQISTIFLIGGLLDNKIISHLDISKITKLDSNIYDNFVFNLKKSNQICHVLQTSLLYPSHQMNQICSNFIECLEILKLKHKLFIVYIII